MSGQAGKSQEWLADAYFQCLGYLFRLRWDSEEVGRLLGRVLGRFKLPSDRVSTRIPPTPNVPPVYSLCRSTNQDELWMLRYGDEILIGPASFDETLGHLFWHINAETTRVTGSYLLIHAGAVSTPTGDGIILCGTSGSGKTTLVTGLVRAGFGYLSDEMAAIDPISRRVDPYAKALVLKKGSFGLFPDLEVAADGVALEDQWLVLPEALGTGGVAGPCPVRWIITLRHQGGASVDLSEVTPARAVLELGQHCMNMSHYGSRALPLLAEIAENAASYQLVSGDLAETVAMLEDLTGDRAKVSVAERG